MTKKIDKNQEFMTNEWGTKYLSSEYGWDNEIFQISSKKILCEVENDDAVIKKHNFKHQNDIHSKIRNDNDYDDWDYGTEPIYNIQNS
jgi:hypothetical protein